MENVYLAHHGIKGQKWGVRKYQNEDGTYTDAGLKRYYHSGNSNLKGRALKKVNRLADKAALARESAREFREIGDLKASKGGVKSEAVKAKWYGYAAKDEAYAKKQDDRVKKLQDRADRDANIKAARAKSGALWEKSNNAYNNVGREKTAQGQRAAERAADKLFDEYLSNQQVATQSTHGEKVTRAVLTSIGTAMTVATLAYGINGMAKDAKRFK